jgi:hypothetical protein
MPHLTPIIDVSVLENHHIASTFSVMQDAKYNILDTFGKDDYKKARALMIDCVLATDMSKHFTELGKFKSRIGA